MKLEIHIPPPPPPSALPHTSPQESLMLKEQGCSSENSNLGPKETNLGVAQALFDS